MQSSKGDFSKLEFLAKFLIMRNQTFKKFIIKSAFRNIRLIFYNPEIIFQKICAFPRSI